MPTPSPGRSWQLAVVFTSVLLGLVVLAAIVQNEGRVNLPETRRQLLTAADRLAEWGRDRAPAHEPWLTVLTTCIADLPPDARLKDLESRLAHLGPPSAEPGTLSLVESIDASRDLDLALRLERWWRDEGTSASPRPIHARAARATWRAAQALRRRGGIEALAEAGRLEQALASRVVRELPHWSTDDRTLWADLLDESRRQLPAPQEIAEREAWLAKAALMVWADVRPFGQVRSRWSLDDEAPWDLVPAMDAYRALESYDGMVEALITRDDEEAEIAFDVWLRALAQTEPFASLCVAPPDALCSLGDASLHSLARAWEVARLNAASDEPEAETFRTLLAAAPDLPNDLPYPGTRDADEAVTLAPFPPNAARRVLAHRADLETARIAAEREETRARRRARRSLESPPSGQ